MTLAQTQMTILLSRQTSGILLSTDPISPVTPKVVLRSILLPMSWYPFTKLTRMALSISFLTA